MADTETRICQNCKASFTIDASDFAFYEKMGVQTPSLCSMCRFRRRAVFRNESTLYKRICALCQKQTIAMYHPDSPYVVYCSDCWHSDKWDPFVYGIELNPGEPFFAQFGRLVNRVPKAALYINRDVEGNVNSEYTNFGSGLKDCYLLFNSGPGVENAAYSRGVTGRDIFDSYFTDKTEQVYECVDVHKSTGVAWADHVNDSMDSWFLRDCSGCSNCFGCVNLRHKSYCFFNEPLSKEEWKKKVGVIVGSYAKIEEVKAKFEEFAQKFPQRENHTYKSIDSTGNYIFQSKNTKDSYEASDCEDVRFAFAVKDTKDAYDLLGHGRKSEYLLEGVGTGMGQRMIATWWGHLSHDIEYCFATRSSGDCIGCDGIRNGKYVILNKRYDEDSYKKIKAQIVDELKRNNCYGSYFPPSLALFAYNETVGQDNLPMTKEEALAQGFRWEDNIPRTKGQETITPEEIPDHIRDVPDSILNEVLRCVVCGNNYRFIPAELNMYRKAQIPVPRKCFQCRHLDRIRRRGSFVSFARKCAKCNKDIRISSLDNSGIFYCGQCYNAEVM